MNLQKIEKPVDSGIRSGILNVESKLRGLDGSFEGDTEICPLKHSFADGIYVREIFIPAGTMLTGKIHKHDHPNFLMKGEVLVVTESNGEEILKAPLSMISASGTKRVLYSITDLVWITVHHNPTNTQDLKELENIIIAENYPAYEKHIGNKHKVINRLKKFIIKKLLI